jgi:tetratricopeptide (TPR) repeat protein
MLKDAGLDFCADSQAFRPHEPFKLGEPIPRAIVEAIEQSRDTLAVVTQSYLRSPWCEFERRLSQARDPSNRRRLFIPVLKERCKLPLDLSSLLYADFSSAGATAKEEWERLLAALGAPRTVEPPSAPGPEGWCIMEPHAAAGTFAGRSRQLKLLDEWLDADVAHPVLVLQAPSGYGKSALAWHWLLHYAPRRWSKVVWWSFSEPTHTMRRFIAKTLSYLAAGITAEPGKARDGVSDLLDCLRSSVTLVVLDDIEATLRSRDGESMERLGDRFLRGMASLPGIASKMLVLTRLRPRALAARDGAPLAGCREERLGPLAPAEACDYLRRHGIAGTRVELERACKRYDFHPLAINLLAAQVVSDLEKPGDIAAARHVRVSGDAAGAAAESLVGLGTSARSLLHWIACFRGAVSYGALSASARQRRFLDRDLRELLDHGVMHRNAETGAFNLHPLVRHAVTEGMSTRQRRAEHRRLADYFASCDAPSRPRRLDELTNLIELCYHAAQGGQFDRAYAVLHDRLFALLHYQFGEYVLDVELLSAFFPAAGSIAPRLSAGPVRTSVFRMHLGTIHPRHLADESPRSWILTALGLSLRASGEPLRAMPLFATSRAIDAEIGDIEGLLVDLINLSDVQWEVGALRASEKSLQEQIHRSHEGGKASYEAVAHQDLGLRLAYRGRWVEADEQFQEALELGRSDLHRRAVIWAHRARKELLQVRMALLDAAPGAAHPAAGRSLNDAALSAAREARRLLNPKLRERHYVRAFWLLGAAYRVGRDLARAESCLQRSLRQCRSINLLDFEAEILLELARTRRGQGRRDEARDLADEGLLIAQRGGYVLTTADAQFFLATIASDMHDLSAARRYAVQALASAWCDGPPYRYEVAYQEARALLRHLRSARKVGRTRHGGGGPSSCW